MCAILRICCFPRMWSERMASSYKNWTGGNEAAPTQKRKPDLFHYLSTQLYVLALFLVELCRTAERCAGKWRTGTWELDNRNFLVG